MAAPYAIDTQDAMAVAKAVKAAFARCKGRGSEPLLDRLFADVTGMFAGRHQGYQRIDMVYHDLEHTLQATLCLSELLAGRDETSDQPRLAQRDWEMAIAAVLLHDTGYLKKLGDNVGTGAKYTFVHELRSCEFARAYLPGLGFTPAEIDEICSAILCTGPRGKLGQMPFRRPETRVLAMMLVTADYLSQMSSPDYVEKLKALFREFQEASEFDAVPMEKRPFPSFDKMLAQTPAFWGNYVRPMLDSEAGGVHRYLSTAGRPNPYLRAVEANLSEVHRRLHVGAGHI